MSIINVAALLLRREQSLIFGELLDYDLWSNSTEDEIWNGCLAMNASHALWYERQVDILYRVDD